MKHKQIGFLCQSLVKMEKSFVSVNGTPAKLITLGQRVEDKPKNVVLIFPGTFFALKNRLLSDEILFRKSWFGFVLRGFYGGSKV